ncbi:hypothetical protein PR048_003180 [Dryococelus australis]|uniref:Uncharacterized protein n=1 Tax=Dryococelus australis TaxID=614101 RepID=A0ABQ9IMD6_9NEOP|nr:hypothetical protein PR048_003180 [Dryococelus australis]
MLKDGVVEPSKSLHTLVKKLTVEDSPLLVNISNALAEFRQAKVDRPEDWRKIVFTTPDGRLFQFHPHGPLVCRMPPQSSKHS